MHEVAFLSLPVEFSFLRPKMSLKNVFWNGVRVWNCKRQRFLITLVMNLWFSPPARCTFVKLKFFLMLFFRQNLVLGTSAGRNHKMFHLWTLLGLRTREKNFLFNNIFSPAHALYARQNTMIWNFYGVRWTLILFHVSRKFATLYQSTARLMIWNCSTLLILIFILFPLRFLLFSHTRAVWSFSNKNF